MLEMITDYKYTDIFTKHDLLSSLIDANNKEDGVGLTDSELTGVTHFWLKLLRVVIDGDQKEIFIYSFWRVMRYNISFLCPYSLYFLLFNRPLLMLLRLLSRCWPFILMNKRSCMNMSNLLFLKDECLYAFS